MRRNTFAIVSALGLAAAASAASGAQAVDVTGGLSLIRGTFANFGYVGANGLTDLHEVGLWDQNGTLLAQAVVNTNTPSSPAALAGTAWKFEAITPLELPAGTYKLSAFYRTTADPFIGSLNGSFASFNIDQTLVYGAPFVTVGGIENFVEPTSPVSASLTPGFFGPNMQFTVVPEPAALSAIAAMGLLIARRRA